MSRKVSLGSYELSLIELSTQSKTVCWPHIMNDYCPFSHRSNLLRNASVTDGGKYGSLSTVCVSVCEKQMILLS